MDEERVKIHIYDTNQDISAVWKLHGLVNSDRWVCELSDISDFKYFPFCDRLNIRIDFKDGRTKERVFYCDSARNRFIQIDSDSLDFWLKKDNEESEGSKMPYKVTVTKTEEKELEEFWVIHGINQGKGENLAYVASGIIFGDVGKCISKKELDHEPKQEEIAQFLQDCGADFATVEHGYRFSR